MTRAIYLHVLRRAAGRGRRAHPARVRPAHRRAADTSWPAWPSSPGSPTCPTPACCPGVPESIALRFEHFVEPTARLLPGDGPVRPPRVHAVDRRASRRPSALLGIVLAYLWYWQGVGPHGVTERNTARPGRLHGAREQVLPRLPLHRRHRRRHQGPDRPGRLLDQPERHRRRRQRRRRRRRRRRPSGSTRTSTRASSTASSTAPASAPRAPARSCASIQTGKVQQYGACCSAAPSSSPPSSSSSPALAEDREEQHREDFLDDWGLDRRRVPAAGRGAR